MPWVPTDITTPAVNLAVEAGAEVERLIGDAKRCLQPILSTPEHPDLVTALSLLPHLTKCQTLLQIVDSVVASALIRMLELSQKSRSDNTLSLVVDSICLILQTQEGVCVCVVHPILNMCSSLV